MLFTRHPDGVVMDLRTPRGVHRGEPRHGREEPVTSRVDPCDACDDASFGAAELGLASGSLTEGEDGRAQRGNWITVKKGWIHRNPSPARLTLRPWLLVD